MKFRLSGAIVRFAGYQRAVTVPATTLDEALKLLLDRHPALGPVLYDNTGRSGAATACSSTANRSRTSTSRSP